MRKIKHTRLIAIILSFTVIQQGFTQDFIGLANGNYAGVTGVGLNPSSIADSRFKFDINLFSINSYFDNNLVDIKRDAFYRGLFFKSPYNNDYGAVRRDLLSLNANASGERVNAFVDTRVQAPLSMMITTGKKSAIAFNFRSRAGFQVANMARNTARMLYEEINNPALQGITENNSGLETNHLRWQEVGFTYARVLFNSGPHFLKGGFTGKWMMGQAAAFIQSDNLNATFNSPNTLSLQSPLIRYYRSEQADIDGFNTNSFFKDIEDHAFGWDAGITYEFRGRFSNFRYVGDNNEIAERRDMNKYSFRLAAAIVDAGKFTFNKQPLTNDHSANFMNWNFTNARANSFSDFDTAYARQVQYMAGADPTFSMALPTALSANVDLHLVKGFYVNAAMYKPLNSFNKGVQSNLRAAEWFAVTPRFESRQIGVYVPVVLSELNNRTDIGLTLRLGPLFVGSANLGSYLFNEKLPSVDVHAGIKIGITYGKSSQFLRSLQRATKLKLLLDDESEMRAAKDSAKFLLNERQLRGLDSLLARAALYDSLMAARSDSLLNAQKMAPVAAPVPQQPMVNVIVNNYLPGTVPPQMGTPVQQLRDTVVINNPVTAVRTQAIAAPANLQAQTRVDSLLQQREREIEYLIRLSAQNELKLRELGMQRQEDSMALIEMKQQRDRLEVLLNDSIAAWRRALNMPASQQPPAPAVAPAERKGFFNFLRKKETPAEDQPSAYNSNQQQVYEQMLARIEAQNRTNTLSPAQLRRFERSQDGLEEEIRRLRRQVTASTAVTVAATAANTAAMAKSANNMQQVPVPIPFVDTLAILATRDKLMKDTVVVNELDRRNMAALVVAPDTVFVRDTVYLNNMMVVNKPNLELTESTVPAAPPKAVVFFALGSSTVGASGRQILNSFSSELSNFPENYLVRLTGRTDATGSLAINRQIAQRRTQSVSNYLVGNGVSRSRITSSIEIEQEGPKRPDAQSRRVDIEVVAPVGK